MESRDEIFGLLAGYTLYAYKINEEIRRELNIYNLNDITFMKNEQYMHSQFRVWIQSSWEKEHRTTKEKMERPTPMRTEQGEMA